MYLTLSTNYLSMCVSVHAELHWSTSCVMLTSMSGVCKWDHDDLGITSLAILSGSFIQRSHCIGLVSRGGHETSIGLLEWCAPFGAPLGFQEALLHHLAIMIFIVQSRLISTWPKPYSRFTRTTYSNLHLCTTWNGENTAQEPTTWNGENTAQEPWNEVTRLGSSKPSPSA